MEHAGSAAHWRRIRANIRGLAAGWLYDPNVSLIDYGFPVDEGGPYLDQAPRLRVHVAQKIPGGEVAVEAAAALGLRTRYVPPAFADMRVDVIQSSYQLKWSTWRARGRSRARSGGARSRPLAASVSRRGRIDPLRGGISVSDAYRPISGTLGCPVVDRRTGERMILSNWHVLAGSTGWVGMPIVQPGRSDGGRWDDQVGTLAAHSMGSNLDAAVARLSGGRSVSNEPWGLPAIAGTALAQLGMRVMKSGRTTGVTHGVVTGVEGQRPARYRGVGVRVIRNVMSITPGDAELSQGGDSGSVWVDEETMKAVGLHFAGNTPGQAEEALAMDIDAVLDALEVDLDL